MISPLSPMSYTISSLGSDGVVDLASNGGKFNFNDASVIGRAVVVLQMVIHLLWVNLYS